jgi:hypothetical protein
MAHQKADGAEVAMAGIRFVEGGQMWERPTISLKLTP